VLATANVVKRPGIIHASMLYLLRKFG
jgi:hypothetical protein